MHDGYCYFTTDDGIFYIDYLDTDGVTLRRKPISGPGKSIEYIVGTQTESTGSWSGVTKDSSLEIGKTIAYKLPYAGSGNASLTLTFTNPIGSLTTGAIAVYTNNSRVTTHYSANAVILLTYDGTYWRASEYWNSNSRDPGYGKITPAGDTGTSAVTANTTQVTAGTYNEALTLKTGNKWLTIAGTQGESNEQDVLTIGHSLSNVTAGNYGDSSNQTPNHGSTFQVPYISVDKGGHITSISSHTVAIPANPNTDYKVRQTNDASDTDYRILLSYAANNDQVDNITHKSGNLIYNPADNKLSTGNLVLTGTLDVTGDTNLHNSTAIDSLTAGSLIVTGNSRFSNDVDFVQIPTAPTAAAGTNNTQLATTEFVKTAVSQGFGANDAMIFKGTLGSAGTETSLPKSGYSAGWTYRVATSGTYAGEYCEVGDLLIAINDGPSSGTSVINDDWAKIEHNIDGALYKTYSTSYSGGKVLVSSGTNGAVKEGTTSTETVIKTITFSAGSVPTLGTAIPADDITAWSAGSLPTLGTAISADDITAWDAGSVPTLGTAIPADDITSWSAGTLPALTISSVSCDDITSWNAGAVTTASVENGVLTITTGTKASLSYTSRSVGSASNWSTGSLPSLSYTAKSIPNVTDVGSAPSLSYTSRSIPNVTGVGTLPSLSYTAKSIPNVTKVGTAPTLTTTTQSVVTGIS